jgi:hypothetical protein
MTIEDVAGSVGANGRAILEELRAIANGNPHLIMLRETPVGFQVCVVAQGSTIPLVQMWGASGNESAHSLETRMQWITAGVFLNNSERLKVATLFQRAQFKPTSGSYGNLRLEYDEARTSIAFDLAEMTKLRGAILETAKLVASLKK